MADGRGMQQAIIHPAFRENAEQLAADADNLSKASLGQAQRQWQVAPLRGWSGDPLDVAGVSVKFDRKAIHENYTGCLSDPDKAGTVADTQALTLQNDWVAMQERAFRTRHATSVRSAIHAAARRSGHAHPQGVVMAGLVKYIQDVIKRGS